MFISNRLTPLDPDSAAKALSVGYKKVTGKSPDQKTLSLLIGQVALETANFKSIHNYNFGNVRGESPSGDYTSFRASEIIDGKEVFFEEGDPKNKFRAYTNASDGAADYVKMLKSRPHWWEGLQSKTSEGFVKGLTTYPAYFTASPSLYSRVLSERTEKYTALAKKYASTGISIAVVSALAASFGYFGVKRLRQG